MPIYLFSCSRKTFLLMNSVITCSNACFFDLFWQFKCVQVSPSRLIHISFLNQCKSLTSKCLVGSNGGHFRRSWCGATGILIIFRLMFPASYSQGSLYALALMESPLGLFIVRGYSSCLGKVQQSDCLKENFPLVLICTLQFSLP